MANYSAGIFGHAGCLGLAVNLKNGKESNSKMPGVKNEGKNTFLKQNRVFPLSIKIPNCIVKFDFLPISGLYSKAKETSLTRKTRTESLGGFYFYFYLKI